VRRGYKKSRPARKNFSKAQVPVIVNVNSNPRLVGGNTSVSAGGGGGHLGIPRGSVDKPPVVKSFLDDVTFKDMGPLVERFGSAACDYIPNDIAKAACKTGAWAAGKTTPASFSGADLKEQMARGWNATKSAAAWTRDVAADLMNGPLRTARANLRMELRRRGMNPAVADVLESEAAIKTFCDQAGIPCADCVYTLGLCA